MAAASGGGDDDEPAAPEASPADVEELGEEALEKQGELVSEAVEAIEDEDYEFALDRLSAAVALGCAGALLYRRRAQVLLHLGRPRAAVQDCTRALEANPGLGGAYKLRGRARARLKQWEEAHHDFQESLRLDFDEACLEEADAVKANLEEQRAAQELASGQLWEVVGGADKGGILVRQGRETTSVQLPQRLALGSTLLELELVGDRLRYRLVKGSGPGEGWISTCLKDKVLACRMAAGAAVAVASAGEGNNDADAAAPEEEEEEEPPFPDLAPQGVDELTEEAEDKQHALNAEAVDALEDGDLPTALQKLSEAVALGCATALLYSRRAQVLLQLGRPKATINDCTAALAINPNQAKAFKIRARAHAKLKHWTEAHSDFQVGLKIDYDDATYEESKPVAEKMKEIQAVAADRRHRTDEAEAQRKLKEAKAAQVAAQEARVKEEQRRAQELSDKKFAESKLAREPFFQLAKRQGYMTDFMGTKRGRCKCNGCDVYVWRPVRVSS